MAYFTDLLLFNLLLQCNLLCLHLLYNNLLSLHLPHCNLILTSLHLPHCNLLCLLLPHQCLLTNHLVLLLLLLLVFNPYRLYLQLL